jgi:hypothetical protein
VRYALRAAAPLATISQRRASAERARLARLSRRPRLPAHRAPPKRRRDERPIDARDRRATPRTRGDAVPRLNQNLDAFRAKLRRRRARAPQHGNRASDASSTSS